MQYASMCGISLNKLIGCNTVII